MNSAVGYIKGLPKTFWVAFTGTVGVILFSMLNWMDATISYGYLRDIPVKFNFRMLLGDFGHTGLYFIQGTQSTDPDIMAHNMRLYSTTRIISIISAALFLAALVFLLFALVRNSGKLRVKATLLGFSCAALSSLLFVSYIIIATGETIASGVTIFPLAVLVISLISMMYVKEPEDISNKKMRKFIHQKAFFFMTVPIIVYVFIFNYLPLTGWAMAFQDFVPGRDSQEWVGFGQFTFMLNGFSENPVRDIPGSVFFDNLFYRVMRNTLAMSVINLVLSFTTSIFLALMINEVRQKLFKRVVQTISYLPHFLSWVIAASIISSFLAGDGILNQILMFLRITDEPILFRGQKENFWWIIGWGNVWKSVGWNTIIYLAAITAIDPELYESAELDGAGRFAKMWHITLPGIKSTILVLLIMSIGWILNAGFEPQYLLGNVLVRDYSETIDIAVLRYGIENFNYSLATALGMFKTVVSIILITGANQLSKRIAKESLV
ncbi:MAG: ABC transporter permease subunit [Oscillospiraceae bacterium]|nr:ABC transporter permease subunit [Oscillospiraceae bacterium]